MRLLRFLRDEQKFDSVDQLRAQIQADAAASLPIAQGLVLSDDSSGSEVTALLTTSDASFSKVSGYGMSTYERVDDDIGGPFAVALTVEDSGGGQIAWFASDQFLADEYNALSSGANQDLLINTLSGLIGESEAMAIRSRSLSYSYLTINAATASLLQILMIGVFPLGFLAVGICIVVRRRRMQHVPV